MGQSGPTRLLYVPDELFMRNAVSICQSTFYKVMQFVQRSRRWIVPIEALTEALDPAIHPIGVLSRDLFAQNARYYYPTCI